MKVTTARTALFGPYALDLRSGELRKFGTRIKMGEQPFQILRLLLETPGEMVTREELRAKLWAKDTFVDFDHGLNSAVQRLRDCLSDTAAKPRWVEAIPRRGYRFIGQVEWSDGVVLSQSNGEPAALQGEVAPGAQGEALPPKVGSHPSVRSRIMAYCFAAAMMALVAGAVLFTYRGQKSSPPATLRALTRLTFDDGLQIGATWSPDGRFIAYSSNRGGKFDIWVQQVSAGDPVRITEGPGHNWQPDWSPDGKYIAYRSENGEGGLFVIPALGGAGLERKISAFGYHPRWSPDGSQILFRTTQFLGLNRFFVVTLDGSQPREVLAEFLAQHKPSIMSAAWHPDGRRVSAWVWDSAFGPNFWTVPLAGGVAVKSEIAPEVTRQVEEIAGGIVEFSMDFDFRWAPSGQAIYYASTFRGARNLWKMTVDPGTLRATAIERVTTGPGPDAELALSPDGRKLAFTAESQHIRAWLFPFDASRGNLTGTGHAVTPPGMATWRQSLSRDGENLAFSGSRGGRSGLWEMSLLDSRTTPVVADDQFRDSPLWSPDGKRLVYERYNSLTHEARLVLWSPESRNEEPVSDSTDTVGVYDWSPDGKWLLVSQLNKNTKRAEIWLLPLAGAPNAKGTGRKIISHAAYDLYSPHFSREGRWIVFQAVRDLPTTLESTLYVTPASGGPWIPLTEGKHWDDKPRWSPNGRMIYFVSGRSGFFNLWGMRFDPAQGRPIGEPFAVTKFESPALMVPEHIPSVELSLDQEHLVLTVEQVSGSIWVLDNMGP